MRFSLIICTLGRSQPLADLFESLLLQNRTDFEVILVDQNDDLRLVEIVARFSSRLSIEHIRQGGKGAALARNVGLDHASGELIGFPDDDCQYLAGYLDKVGHLFDQEPSIQCITGHPTDNARCILGTDCYTRRVDLDTVTVLNRCQEFTIFVRRQSLGDLRYNECLGVGALTPWGADEGPDLLIRLIQTGARTVYFPLMFVYHPNKLRVFDRATLQRAAGYSRGRGCLFRLHRFPRRMVLRSIFRPMVGVLVYLLKFQPRRSLYYLTTLRGILRGLLMTTQELAEVRKAQHTRASTIQPISLSVLSKEPLVSVLIANYNYARFLPTALDALLSQTYANWHAIVCDDGSSDNSVAVVQQYCKLDSRIQLIQQTNAGQNAAYNACYQQARGEIVCFLDADDVFAHDKIQQVVDSFLANPEAGMCNHFCQVIDGAGLPQNISMHGFLDSGWLAHKALARGACVYVPTTSCMSIRRQIGAILFPVTARQDRDLDGFLAMAAQFLAPVCVIDQKLAYYRIHGNNMGGLTQPTAERLHYELQLIRQRTANVEHFVAQRLGEKLSAEIVLEDNPQYIQAALKLLAIQSKAHRRPEALALIRRHPEARWRAIWRLIFIAPEFLGRHAVPWMHGSHRAKSLVHRLMGRGKVATT